MSKDSSFLKVYGAIPQSNEVKIYKFHREGDYHYPIEEDLEEKNGYPVVILTSQTQPFVDDTIRRFVIERTPFFLVLPGQIPSEGAIIEFANEFFNNPQKRCAKLKSNLMQVCQEIVAENNMCSL